MKSLVCVSLFVAVATASVLLPKLPPITQVKDATGGRIISGTPAEVGQFPWQVANTFKVSSNKSAFCGGALICDQWVLTAAHCAQGALSFKLVFGVVNRTQENEPGRVVMETTEKHVHPGYSTSNLNNDIALIKLPEKIGYTDNIQPIRLGKNRTEADLTVTVSGWGKVNDEPTTPANAFLNYVDLATISNKDCEDVYGLSIVTDKTICCRGNPEHSTCNGDSGGPLVRQADNRHYDHVGVVSFVSDAGCASGNPSGYVRTASYIDWIQETIGDTCTLL